MTQFSPLRVRAWARVALLFCVIAVGLGLRPDMAWASHIRAGDIQAKIDTTANPNPRRVFFKMILYTTEGPGVVDQPAATIFFGDGTSSCKDGVPRVGGRRPVPGSTDTSVNIYLFEHTYPSTGSFVISFIGENRIRGVLNTDQSDTQSFYISTSITLDPALGLNHSPILTAPAVDKGGVGQVFLHNPGAYDADGDSLSLRLRSSQWVPAGVDGTVGGLPCTGGNAGTGNNQPTTKPLINFHFPNDPVITPGTPPVQVPYNGVPAGIPGAPAIFMQNPATGQITWNAPVAPGIYNVAIVVEEWRRTPLGRRKIGEVIRDMQIIVAATNNLRPTIMIPPDLCVVAGQPVTGIVTATDGSSPTSTAATAITLFAYSGIIPPATFIQSLTGPPLAQGQFNWQTECRNVAALPYQVVFKAQDTPNPVTPTNPILIDEKTWRITVVGPPPQNLRAVSTLGSNAIPNRVQLTWSLYQCGIPFHRNAIDNRVKIHIYRKLDTSTFQPGPCDTGIPASAGYTRIATVADTVTNFIDGNTSTLTRGKTYCYRIYAEFPLPAGGASIASQEACASFPGRAAMLTNVDVEATTTTTGRILVRWTQPRTAAGTTFDGTPSYELSRGEGLNPTVFTPISSSTFGNIADTIYVDSGLNTQDLQYTYKLVFVRTFPSADGRPPAKEDSPTASSVRTSAAPANPAATAINVSWTYNVPWDNSGQPATIFRRTGGTGPYTRIGTAPTGATGGTYVDNDRALVKDQTYCYYVQTDGRYAGFAFLSSLINRSQERCLVLSSPPCTPVLVLQPINCDSLAALQEFPRDGELYSNRLKWTLSNNPTGCDSRIASYKVFYRPTLTGKFTQIGTTTQTSFVHQGLAFSGGCYAVQAVAPSGIVSDTSNVACQDNCVFFKLPNIFTPNGDNKNAVFRPKNFSPIRTIHFKVFNRWGVKVFENTTTSNDRILINWDGGGPVGESGNGKANRVSDGIYYYLAEVAFADFANTKRVYKGWVEIVR